MRKIVFLAILLVGMFVLATFSERTKRDDLRQTSENSSFFEKKETKTEIVQDVVGVNFAGLSLEAGWIAVEDPLKLSLIANFDEKLAAKAAKTRNSCKSLTSAGLYTKANRPLGLFVSEGEKIAERVENQLFNGVFSVSFEGKVNFSDVAGSQPLRIALQSGPFLIKDSSLQKIRLKRDEFARRVVVSQSQEGVVFFLVVYDKESVFLGPKLTDITSVLSLLQEKIGVRFKNALALDGGTASAFLTDSLNLPELSTVGGFFCIGE